MTDPQGQRLKLMLHEARDRQKFLSDVQYLRDMQHKVESEYQACLRRRECRKDPNEKKRDQLGKQETNLERSQFSSRSSSTQSSGEEDPLAEPRLSTKNSETKCDYKLPSIGQTSVKQKHKVTMTTMNPEKVGPSKPSPAVQPPQILSRKRRPNLGRLMVSPYMQSLRAPEDRGRQKSQLPAGAPALRGAAVQPPQILSRKRRPNLGRLMVSPYMQSLRAPEDRGRQKSQLPAGAPALRGADPVQREDPLWARDSKLKRPTRERRNLVPPSQPLTMTKNTPERARQGDPHALTQNEPHPALFHTFPGTKSPQVLSESLGPPLTTTPMGGSRRAPFRFRDEDFYSMLSLSHGGKEDDTDKETHEEEELLLVGMHPPRSPPNHKRSQFLPTSVTQAKNKNCEENPENCRASSARRSETRHGSLRISSGTEPVAEQPPDGQRMFPDHKLPAGGPTEKNDGRDSENEKKAFHSQDTKSEPNLDDLSAGTVFSGCTSMEDRPGTHDYERGCQDYLNNSSASLDCFLSGRPTPPTNSAYNTPGSLMPSALRGDAAVDLSSTSALVPSSDSEGSSRFNVCQPLCPVRNRHPCVRAENHSSFPVNSAREFYVRGAEAVTLTSQSQEAPLNTEDFLLNPPSSLSLAESPSSSPPRMNLQGHLHVPGSLRENIPFTIFAVSDFLSQNGHGNRMAVSGFTDEKKATKIKADPEKLKKLRESLLEEDSEEEGDLCRICQIAGGSPTNPLLEPCGCVGSLRFVHQECLKMWLKVKVTSGVNLGTVKTCEMCKQGLQVDLDDFNVTEFYRQHLHFRVQNELMNSGSYLVLLLHLYKFAGLMRLNYTQILREMLSRFFPQHRPEENESRFGDSEAGEENENSIFESNSPVV